MCEWYVLSLEGPQAEDGHQPGLPVVRYSGCDTGTSDLRGVIFLLKQSYVLIICV